MIEIIDLGSRIFLGAFLLYSGLNGFFHWRPVPPTGPRLAVFVAAFEAAGYLMTVVKTLEVLIGLCLLTGFFVPLALLALVPLLFGIVSLQLLLNEPRGWVISLVLLIPFLTLLMTRGPVLQGLLQP